MNNNNIFNISSNTVAGNILYMVVTLIVVALFIAGIIYLIKLAQECMTYTGYYEPFATVSKQSQYIKELKERIQKIKELNEVLDDSIDTFGDNVQDTCEVYAQVEEVYVGNNSSPSEEEFGLPKEELNKRLDRRKDMAKRRFKEARGMYGASIKTQVYECFANPNPESAQSESISDLEEELRNELEDLEAKIQSVERGPVGQKGIELNALIKFNNKYIKKSLQEMGNERARLIEGFYTAPLPPPEYSPLQTVSGSALLKRADSAIISANKIYGFVSDQRTVVKTQKELASELTKASSRLQSGNITEADVS